MIILGIDPGARESGAVMWDVASQEITWHGTKPNGEMLALIDQPRNVRTVVAIEQIRGYGIVAGDDTFDTCEAVGRFEQMALIRGWQVLKIPRKDIKRALCGNTTTNDKYVRQALIDRIGPQGSKKQPGPTFGIAGHCWAALAVCVVASDKLKEV